MQRRPLALGCGQTSSCALLVLWWSHADTERTSDGNLPNYCYRISTRFHHDYADMGHSIERAERDDLNSVLAHSQVLECAWITVGDRELVPVVWTHVRSNEPLMQFSAGAHRSVNYGLRPFMVSGCFRAGTDSGARWQHWKIFSFAETAR